MTRALSPPPPHPRALCLSLPPRLPPHPPPGTPPQATRGHSDAAARARVRLLDVGPHLAHARAPASPSTPAYEDSFTSQWNAIGGGTSAASSSSLAAGSASARRSLAPPSTVASAASASASAPTPSAPAGFRLPVGPRLLALRQLDTERLRAELEPTLVDLASGLSLAPPMVRPNPRARTHSPYSTRTRHPPPSLHRPHRRPLPQCSPRLASPSPSPLCYRWFPSPPPPSAARSMAPARTPSNQRCPTTSGQTSPSPSPSPSPRPRPRRGPRPRPRPAAALALALALAAALALASPSRAALAPPSPSTSPPPSSSPSLTSVHQVRLIADVPKETIVSSSDSAKYEVEISDSGGVLNLMRSELVP